MADNSTSIAVDEIKECIPFNPQMPKVKIPPSDGPREKEPPPWILPSRPNCLKFFSHGHDTKLIIVSILTFSRS